MEEQLANLLKDEEALQFASFNEETAWPQEEDHKLVVLAIRTYLQNNSTN